MKNTFLLLASLSIFTLVSCSDDDDNDSGNGGVGSGQTTAQKLTNSPWTSQKTDVIAYYINTNDTILDTTTYQTDESYDFKADGTYDYKYQGSTIEVGTWLLSTNDNLILQSSFRNDTLEIFKITSTELIFYLEDIDSTPIGDLKTEVTSTFVR